MSSGRHPSDTTPSPAVGWEECERIAERVAKATVSDGQRECEREGAIFIVWKEIGKMKDRINKLEALAHEARGATEAMAKSNVRTMQILAGLAALSTVVGFILNHWPHK